jgi:hypothetical protein
VIRFWAAVLLLIVCAAPAHAHTRSQSQSLWIVDGDRVEARIEADAVDVTRLYALGGDAPIGAMFTDEVAAAFTVSANGQRCEPSQPPRQGASEPGRVIVTWRFACPGGALARGPLEIESRLFLRVAPSHLHFAAVRDGDGRTGEAVLTSTRPHAMLTLTEERETVSFWEAVRRFLPVGVQHVWSGLDHIAFMLALVLLVGGALRPAIFAATGFTLGHTATLGLAATGVLRPDTAAIEALIGFTIAFVALEAGDGGRDRMKSWSAPIAAALAIVGLAALFRLAPLSPLIWFGLAAFVFAYPRGFPQGAIWLAVIFGLIHGCGFAGALAELDLPRPRLLASLLGFNLGVEAGQIAVIGSALIVALAIRRLPSFPRAVAAQMAGAALVAIGSYWFVGRLIG